MRKWGTLVAALVVALVATGCGWRQMGFGPERTGFNVNESTIGAIYWQETFSESGFDLELYPPVVLEQKAVVPAGMFGTFGGSFTFDPATKTYTGGIGTGGNRPFSSVATRSNASVQVVGQFTSGGSLKLLQYGANSGFINFGDITTPLPTTEPALVGNLGLVGHFNQIRAFELGTCPGPPPGLPTLPFCYPKWSSTNLGSTPSMPVGVSNALIAVGTSAGDIVMLNAADGTVSSSTDLGTAAAVPPVVAYNTIYAATQGGKLAALPTSGCTTCTPLWTADLGAAINTQPAIGNGVVYVGAADGKVHAFNANGCGAATCSELWSATVDASADVLHPVITNGRLYVSADTGTVKTFKLP